MENKDFKKAENINEVLEILSFRDTSAHVYNLASTISNYPDKITFYTLGDTVEETCWIIGKHIREDIGAEYEISVPNNLNTKPIPGDVVDAFKNVSKPLIDWDTSYHFISVNSQIVHMLVDISNSKGNSLQITPLNYYLFPKSKNITQNEQLGEVELKSLNSDLGIKHLNDDWQPVNECSKLLSDRCAKKCFSIGAYTDGKVVGSAMMNPSGDIGLNTNVSYRRKGFASACLKMLVSRIRKASLIPVTIVYVKNEASNSLQRKVGFELQRITYDISYREET